MTREPQSTQDCTRPSLTQQIKGTEVLEQHQRNPCQHQHRRNDSKCSDALALSYRMGWAITPQFHADISRAKFFSSVACPTLQQLVLARYYASGGYDRYLRRARAMLCANMQNFMDAITRHFPTGTRVGRPAGGLVIWVELPRNVDGTELFRSALASRIGIAPGVVFSAKADYRNYIRLSCGMPWTPTIDRAIEKLGRMVAVMARAAAA